MPYYVNTCRIYLFLYETKTVPYAIPSASYLLYTYLIHNKSLFTGPAARTQKTTGSITKMLSSVFSTEPSTAKPIPTKATKTPTEKTPTKKPGKGLHLLTSPSCYDNILYLPKNIPMKLAL